MKKSNQKWECDVAVAGAGPAGITAAFLLSQAGYRVILLDKAHFPREKLCGGCLTAKTVRLLEEIFSVSPASLLEKKVIDFQSNRFAIHYKNQVLVDKATAPSYTFHFVDRSVYDHFFLEKARQVGVIVLEGEKITGLDTGNNWIITGSGKKIAFRTLVAADGVNSKIRSLLFQEGKLPGRKWRHHLGMAVETRIDRAAAGPLRDLAHPVLSFGYLHYGYGWLFPNKDRLVIGIGGLQRKLKKRKLPQILVELMSDFGIDYRVMASPGNQAINSNMRGFPLPFGNFLVEPAWGNILLTGDAAGLADPMLGEGIFQAHQAGQLAAQAIIDSRDNHLVAKNYCGLLQSHLLPELVNARRMRRIVYMRLNHLLRFRIVRWVESQFGRLVELIHGDRTYRFPHPRKKNHP